MILILIFSFILGSAIGSFLNVGIGVTVQSEVSTEHVVFLKLKQK